MTASAAALSGEAINYADSPTDAVSTDASSTGPVALEDWKAELWRRVGQRLQDFFFLKEDWDGAGAEAPSRDALLATIEYLVNLSLSSRDAIPPTALSPTPLGSVVLEWRLNDTYLEAEISGRKLIGWMKRDPDGSVKVW